MLGFLTGGGPVKMLRPALWLMPLFLVAGAAAVAVAEDEEPSECDLAKIEPLDYCADCQVLVEKQALNDKGEHADCGKKPVKADFCVKTYYLCEACGTQGDAPGKCPTCQADLKEKLSKSKVLYMCRKCGATADAPRKCDMEGCPNKGQDYVKTCQDSGIPPHVKKK